MLVQVIREKFLKRFSQISLASSAEEVESVVLLTAGKIVIGKKTLLDDANDSGVCSSEGANKGS